MSRSASRAARERIFGKQLDRIELETERLDMLIGQMLQLSQLRAVEPLTKREHVDVSSLLAEIVEDAKLEAGAAQKDVTLAMQGTLSTEGDHALLRSAIENVIRNAIRFTPGNTIVEVYVKAERGLAIITVHLRSRSRCTAAGVGADFRTVLSRGGISRPRLGRHRAGTCDHSAGRAALRRIGFARNSAEGGLSVELRLPICTLAKIAAA